MFFCTLLGPTLLLLILNECQQCINISHSSCSVVQTSIITPSLIIGVPCHDNCSVFASAKNHYKFTVSTLDHLEQYSHDNLRVPCRYGDNCKAYARCVENGFRLDDRCHLLMYKHPPRNRSNQVPRHWNVFDTQYAQNVRNGSSLDPRWQDLSPNCTDRMVEKEVSKNGFQRVLTTRDGHSLNGIVDQKLRHLRNRSLPKPLCYDEMLSVILYTGCDCYGDLRKAERSGDFEKWKYFGASLTSAINKLRDDEHAKKPRLLYSGMENVGYIRNNDSCRDFHHLDTFTSFSWDRSVAEGFANDNGVVFEFLAFPPDDGCFYDRYVYAYGCADVSWISKFPDECEYLLSRGFAIMSTGEARWKKSAHGKRLQIVPTRCHGWVA